MTRRSSSAISPTSRCTVSTSSVFSRPIGLSAISGVMRPFMVPSTSCSMLASTLDFESASKVSPRSCDSSAWNDESVPVSAPSSASSRPVVVRAISSTASVTRVSKRASSSENERSMTSTSTVTFAARSARAPTFRQRPDRGDRVVGLGDDPHDLVVGLLELPEVDDAVGHQDPRPCVNIIGCALIAPLLGRAPAEMECARGV